MPLSTPVLRRRFVMQCREAEERMRNLRRPLSPACSSQAGAVDVADPKTWEAIRDAANREINIWTTIAGQAERARRELSK